MFFKSVFTKYITVFMLIIFFSFAMLIAITSFTVNNYALSAKEKIVINAADSVNTFVMNRLVYDNVTAYGEYLNDNSEEFKMLLDAIAINSDKIAIILTDNYGSILLSDSVSDKIKEGDAVPKQLMDEINNGADVMAVYKREGIFTDVKYIHAVPVYLKNGMICGTIFVLSYSAALIELLDIMIKTIVLSSLCVMLSALIAVYFISEKVIGPLNSMSAAVRAFAAGDYSARVKVVGKDEVAELATSFNNMAETLSHTEEMRNIFMASAAHELRTPMTSIAGYIDNMLCGAIPPSRYNEYLNIVAVEVRRLSRLVTSLLDLSRLQAKAKELNIQKFDICEVARLILISLESRIDDKKLEVEFDVTNDNMFVMADKDSIYQILYNICDNAVKFSYIKGLLRIKISSSPRDKKVTISVYNEGQGISSDDLPHVFSLFYKSDKSRGLDKSGVGLGLYIAKTIIKEHNEEMSVTSEEGKYCEFVFTLPLAKTN